LPGRGLARITEVESRRKTTWPELAQALQLAEVSGATLVIAKLDRLSGNAAFPPALRDSWVRFVTVDMPKANDLTMKIMAFVGQSGREAISRRTNGAQAVTNSTWFQAQVSEWSAALNRAGIGSVSGKEAASINAAASGKELAPVLADTRAEGHTSLRTIEASWQGAGSRRGVRELGE
jgi:hypothetical protein